MSREIDVRGRNVDLGTKAIILLKVNHKTLFQMAVNVFKNYGLHR